MNPTKSIIYFTVISGFGYGVIMLIFILIFFSNLELRYDTKILIAVLSILLVSSGTISSTMHSGYFERVWESFNQWKRSWLSCEGLFAVITFFPIVVFFLIWLFFENIILYNISISIAGIFSLITVFCTAMIYTSLKTIPTWNNILVPVLYIFNSLVSGGVLLFYIYFIMESYSYFLYTFLMILLSITLFIKLLYWYSIKKIKSNAIESVVDLNKKNKVSFFEEQHTGQDYLTREMLNNISKQKFIYQRFITIICTYILPIYILWNTPLLNISIEIQNIIYLLMLVFFIIGIFLERKLFFLEANHEISLYYGNSKI